MTVAHVLTVTAMPLSADDPAARQVARALLGEGMPVASRQMVDEDEASLERALGAALAARGLVVVLASPGGSAGEIARRTLARLTGARLVLNPKLRVLLEEDFARRGLAVPHRLDRLALLPQGALLLPAPSGEPAWTLPARDAVVVVIPLASPHVPALIGEWVRPLARRRLLGEVSVLRALHTTGLSAADVEERLGPWLGKAGAVAVSSAVIDGDVSVRLVARGSSRQAAQGELEPVEDAVRSALAEDCYGSDEDTLEAVVGRLLIARALTVAVAESCTGGLIGHRLTNVPGSSRHFDRGVIAYSNRAKEDLLAVPAPLLRTHGAVSGPVAEAMATAVRRLSGASWGLAVSGIAGPEGGTPAKPVGTVFVAAASPGGVTIRQHRLSGGREAVKWQAAQSALDMLRRALLQQPAAGR